MFESGSQLTRFESWTFGCLTSLKSICVPASVEFIGEDCFVGRWSSSTSLRQVRFEAGSKLREIEAGHFMDVS
jgi:hypothetical protein